MGLTAQIQTKYGPTRKITIRDSIRKGGVLPVIAYATLMDEITNEIIKHDMGLELRNGEKLKRPAMDGWCPPDTWKH